MLTKIPVFVWPLLTFLIYGGLRARKTSVAPLKLLIALPLAFCVWTSYAMLSRYGVNAFTVLTWMGCMGVGSIIGMRLVRNLSMRFDKQRNRVLVQGTWSVLLLSMSMFSTRFFLGMIYTLHPEMAAAGTLIPLELLSIVLSGCFVGRLLGLWKKYRVSPDESLS